MPLLVLEGPDGSGKSTLAQKLLKGTGHPTLLVKRSGPPGAVETLEFMSNWLRAQADSGLNIIADRHPIISECIYRPIVRREGAAPWTPAEAARAFRAAGTLIIWCRPPYAAMRKSSEVEEQMDGVHAHYRALADEYDRWIRLFEDWGLPIYRYNFALNAATDEAVRVVKKFWEDNR